MPATATARDGFVTSLRLLCSAAQPYLSALHRWLERGEVVADPGGELFVCAGPEEGVAAIGTEAHWEGGFVLLAEQRGWFGGRARSFWRDTSTSCWRRASRSGSFEAARGAGTAPKMESHLCVDFCDAVRRALETSRVPRMPTRGRKTHPPGMENSADATTRAAEDDESVRLLSSATRGGVPASVSVARRHRRPRPRARVRRQRRDGNGRRGGGPCCRSSPRVWRGSSRAAGSASWVRSRVEWDPLRCPAIHRDQRPELASVAEDERGRDPRHRRRGDRLDIARAAVAPRGRKGVGLGSHVPPPRGRDRHGAFNLAALRAVFLGGAGEAAVTRSRRPCLNVWTRRG